MAENLPIILQYTQALGPTIAALAATGIAFLIQYRMWELSNDKLRLELFERRSKIYDALHLQIMGSDDNIDTLSARIDAAVAGLSGYRFLFDSEVVDIVGRIEMRLMLLRSKLTSYKQGFDIHRFVITELGEIRELKGLLEPLLVKQLRFTN